MRENYEKFEKAVNLLNEKSELLGKLIEILKEAFPSQASRDTSTVPEQESKELNNDQESVRSGKSGDSGDSGESLGSDYRRGCVYYHSLITGEVVVTQDGQRIPLSQVVNEALDGPTVGEVAEQMRRQEAARRLGLRPDQMAPLTDQRPEQPAQPEESSDTSSEHTGSNSANGSSGNEGHGAGLGISFH